MLASHFFLALSLMAITTLTAEKPFDFTSAPGKLPKNVIPEEYAIRITPDVAKKTFSGSETIKLNAREAVKQFVLNSADIQIIKATIDGKAVPASAVKSDEKEETLTIAAEPAAGNHQLDLEFTGKINKHGVG